MPSPSKEESVLNLFLENSPLKEWRFEEIVKAANITKAAANKWLKKYLSLKLIKKIKENGKFPYYTVGPNNDEYYSIKKSFSIQKLHDSGLFTKLLSIKEANTIIIFGSFVNGDWYKDSDIDIFIFGNVSKFNRKFYESILSRDIELHIFQNKNEIKKIKSGLINNIVDGYVLKGSVQDFIKLSK